MVTSDSKARRTFVVLTACTLTVFALLLCALTVVLRSRLQEEIQRREAQAIHDVAVMQITQADARLSRLGVDLSTADVFAAVLESSRLHGVLGVQLFDASGHLRDALPAVPADGRPETWWAGNLSTPEARFHAHGHLEQVLGLAPDNGEDLEQTPLLEVVVPLRQARTGESFGVARYWLDGAGMAAEFGRLDRRLVTQAGTAFAGGALLIGLLLGWSYRRLGQAHAALLEKTVDLARANQELDFAAKTGALGAISAHLIHGLKNPLAGLEGFVNDVADLGDASVPGEARRTARETARRLRTMVNEVVTVLRDETSGAAEYPVLAHEMLGAVKVRAEPLAQAAGVSLHVSPPPEVELVARTANLAGLVLANLLTNAIEASAHGRTVRVESAVADGRIAVLVQDEASGLPGHVRDSLFRPVVSGKPGGGGMGLAISSRLARHAGGELTLVRSDAHGTVFQLTVPTAVR